MNRIALVQLQSSTDKTSNLKKARASITEAKSKASALVAFPEFLMAYSPESQSSEELCELAESIDGEFTSSLRQAAKAADISVLATIYEKSPVRNRVFDTALWIDNSGNIASVYRKLHLYDALGFKESDKFVPGDKVASPVKNVLGQFGIMICYDLRFPELSRILTLLGANVLISPSGWVQGEMKVEHWQTMIRARALENGCYVIAPGQVGNIYIGHSMVVDPFGKVVVDMENREGLEIAELDPAVIAEVREKLPLLKNRRADVYARHITSEKVS